jgi:eukaryotic-like serine/threonine-protein kinase
LEIQMNIKTGTIINQYKIISTIGKGGMGEVFLAQDTKLDRKVAIKFLNEEFSKDADKLNRFIQEAKAVSALNHPNILTVYEIGENDDANFIVTEFIEGKTLREQLSPKQTNSLNSVLNIGVQVAEALSAAHQAGIIHRDIKPENIMIRADGYAKVLDFGLAKLSEPPASAGGSIDSEDTTKGLVKTNPGMVMGTVSYMSPEQARGKETDARTDIWSLGVVLYEMLSGKVPFTGETINHTIVSILEKEPKLLDNVPDELQRIVRKTLAKDVEMRYQSSKDLLIDLKNLRRNLDIQGELERSIVPNREITTNQVQENETAIYNSKSIEETKAESGALATQSVSNSSSLEYAVTKAKSHKFATAIIGIILLSAISAIGFFGYKYFTSTKQINSIAVMPFENKNSDADTDYLSDGLAESLIFRLTQIPDLRVSPTSSVMRYKGKETDIAKIANELGVDAVMTGRLTKRGDNLNITVELVDARTNKSLWGEQYERKLSELLTTQREMVAEIVSKLQLKLSGESEQKLAKKYTDNNEAYQLYLQGRYHWNKLKIPEFEKAIVFFKQAIEKDPNFALAYTGLADTYQLFPVFGDFRTKDYSPQAKQAALKALELDPNLAEAHTSLGKVIYEYEYDFAGAEKSFKRAIELDPNYATARQWYAELLSAGSRHDESRREITKAVELDPFSLPINVWVAIVLQRAGRSDQALSQIKKSNELFSNDPAIHDQNIVIYANLGKYDQAVEESLLGAKANKDFKPENIAKLKEAYEKGGWDSFQRMRQEIRLAELNAKQAKDPNGYVKAWDYAIAYAWGKDKDKTIEYLNKAYDERGKRLLELKVNKILDFVRDDPRFKELVKKVGIPE